jgi:hypothetical protein
VKVAEPALLCGVTLSLTVTVNEDDFLATVGVPERAPVVELKLNPVGKLPAVKLNL